MNHTKLFPTPQVFRVLPKEIVSGAMVVPLFQKAPLGSPAKEIDKKLKGALQRRIETDRFEAEEGKTLWIDVPGSERRLVLVGLGERPKFDRSVLRNAYATACKEILDRKIDHVVLPALSGRGLEENFDAAVEGFLLRTYRFAKYLKQGDPTTSLQSIEIVSSDARMQTRIEKWLPRVVTNIHATFLARDLVNEPANVVTPESFADQAMKLAKASKLPIQILSEEDLRKKGMNLILAVGQGSPIRPRLVHIEYKPKGRTKKSIALVGKGVTFDSGGLSLKGQDNMYGMKGDMSGAAAVLAAVLAVSELKLPVHVHALIPLVENLPSGNAIKPGDVVLGFNGKSVEIENTDAEGRLILADTLSYTKELGVDEVIDAATLTGACVVALGEEIAGILSNDDRLVGRILKAGQRTGEKFWQLPLEKNYVPLLKSDVADMKNVGGKWGGTITAGLFLSEFVDCPSWAHLDIAGPAFIHKEWPVSPKGGTGFAVRTLVELLGGYA